MAPTGALPEIWSVLAGVATPAGVACWDWAQIQSGVAWITPSTQEAFVPQMIGLDTIGGVSFQKGCYPGQEIVARAHYLGEVKRRLHAGHCDQAVQAADALVVVGQVRGSVVNAAPAPEGGSDLLAVMPGDAVGEIRLGSAEGTIVTLQMLAVTPSEPPVPG
jgi:folate-binding protein YgfZ